MIIEEVAEEARRQGITGVTQVMQKVREVSRKRFNEWFPQFPFMPIPGGNPAFMRPQVQLSIAGYDNNDVSKISRMYSLVSSYDFSPNLHDFGFALAGVAQYALYLLNRLYTTDMTIGGLKHLAAYVITETAAQDGKVGGAVQMGVIPPDNNAYMLGNEEIDYILKKNEERSKELKEIFRKL
jgi:hypothetical protein